MKSLVENPTTSLKWLKSDTSPSEFELLGADGVFATFAFLDDEHLLARVKTAEGVWSLKHLGLLNPVVTLREIGGKTNLATYHPHVLKYGKLEFFDGAAFDWEWFHGNGPGGALLDPGGKPLIRFHAHAGRDLKSTRELEQCDLELESNFSTRLRSAQLAAFGWFLILFDHMKERDAVAAETSLRL